MPVRIAYAVARQIANHALAEAPQEACGILAGAGERISLAVPLNNAADAPETQFRFDPNEQLEALKALDAAGLDWLGVYHSHPSAPPIPSAEDIQAAVDSSLLQLIVSLDSAKPRLKLWRLDGFAVRPIALVFDTQADAGIEDHPSRRQQVAMVIAGIASVLLLLAISLLLLPPAPELTTAP